MVRLAGAGHIVSPRAQLVRDGFVRVLPNARVRFGSRSLQAQNIKVRLWFGSHCLYFEFGSVRFCCGFGGFTVLIFPQ